MRLNTTGGVLPQFCLTFFKGSVNKRRNRFWTNLSGLKSQIWRKTECAARESKYGHALGLLWAYQANASRREGARAWGGLLGGHRQQGGRVRRLWGHQSTMPAERRQSSRLRGLRGWRAFAHQWSSPHPYRSGRRRYRVRLRPGSTVTGNPDEFLDIVSTLDQVAGLGEPDLQARAGECLVPKPGEREWYRYCLR